MVNTTLPLPILKYLEMRPEAVETILLEYPFYQLPRVARILIQSKAPGNDVQELNFFGFNKHKLNQYIHVFQQHSVEPLIAEEEVDQSLEISSEPEVPFHDINIVVSEREHLSEEEQSQILNEETIELKDDVVITEENLLESNPKADDFNLSLEELEPIPNLTELIEIDFDNGFSLPDEELAEKIKNEAEKQVIEENKDFIEPIISKKEDFFSAPDLEEDDFDLTVKTPAQIPHPIEPIEIDFDNENSLPDEELSEILTREEETLEITEDTEPNLDDESENYIVIPEISDSSTSSFSIEPLDIELGEINTISDEELASKLEMEDSFNAQEETEDKASEEIELELTQSSTEANDDIEDGNKSDAEDSLIQEEGDTEVENILELGVLKTDIETVDLDESIVFESETPAPNYILPAALELLEREKLEPQAEQTESIESAVEVKTENVVETEVTNEEFENEDIKDFNSWLAAFSTQATTIETESSTEIIDPIEKDTRELDRNIQYSAQQSQVLASYEEEESEDPKINRDDELEGVLKDNFFKSQVEIKKATRKTPSEMRIQDEAQLSLQPLDLVSETMAILHAQQGNTSKAVEIYQKLIRLFPEKSSFFALQIENLRK